MQQIWQLVHRFIIIIIIIISVQPLGQFWQEPEPSQATGMALARCILGKFLGVVCRCFPLRILYRGNIYFYIFITTYTHFGRSRLEARSGCPFTLNKTFVCVGTYQFPKFNLKVPQIFFYDFRYPP
jgi:hypothetical protein